MLDNLGRAIDALQSIPPDLPREEWVRVGMAAKSAGINFDTFHDWSARAGNYQNERDVLSVWNSIRRADGVTAATLFKTAASHARRISADKPKARPARALGSPKTSRDKRASLHHAKAGCRGALGELARATRWRQADDSGRAYGRGAGGASHPGRWFHIEPAIHCAA